jgi:hypothetical protein
MEEDENQPDPVEPSVTRTLSMQDQQIPASGSRVGGMVTRSATRMKQISKVEFEPSKSEFQDEEFFSELHNEEFENSNLYQDYLLDVEDIKESITHEWDVLFKKQESKYLEISEE